MHTDRHGRGAYRFDCAEMAKFEDEDFKREEARLRALPTHK
jgi:hypothetical protein